MKKTILSLLTLFCISAQADEVICQNNWFDPSKIYVEAFGGANFISSVHDDGAKLNFKPGYTLSGSLGYHLPYGLRMEGEYAYRRNSIKNIHYSGETYSLNAHFETSSIMANLIWDIPLTEWGCDVGVIPFVGFGLGYDNQSFHINHRSASFSDHKQGLGKQLIAGLSYPLSCRTKLSVTYKFHQGSVRKIYNHAIGLGLTYDFGKEG